MPSAALLLMAGAALSACAGKPPALVNTPAPVQTSAETTQADTSTQKITHSPFSAATLESLLTAEIAALRQRPDITLQHYLAQATLTRDPAVIARAATITQAFNHPQSLEVAQLWTEVAPHNVDAWYSVALSSMRQLRYPIAIPALEKLLVLQPDWDMEQFFLVLIPPTQSARDVLFEQVFVLSRQHPKNAHLRFALALLKEQSRQPEAALILASEARKLRPQSGQMALLEAKILTELLRHQDAAALLAGTLQEQPDNHNLRLNYARALILAGDLKGSQREFQTLTVVLPDDLNLRLSLALIAFDNHDDTVALRELALITQHEGPHHAAYYYSGLIAARQERTADALVALEKVGISDHYLPALAEIARLYSRDNIETAQQRLASARLQHPQLQPFIYQLEADLLINHARPQAAWELLSTALRALPENTALLLSRSLVAEKLHRLDDAEADLREALRYEPQNPSVLNALGYTLLDRTTRIDESAPYILQAYALKPDDPSIIDSVAWLKFKRGDYAGALTDLRRAYAIYPDDEIASHLGEVLWVLGEHAEARRTWAAALKRHPKSSLIPSVQQRLDP